MLCPPTRDTHQQHNNTQRLGIKEDIQRLSVIHVAGTKGKVSEGAKETIGETPTGKKTDA